MQEASYSARYGDSFAVSQGQFQFNISLEDATRSDALSGGHMWLEMSHHCAQRKSKPARRQDASATQRVVQINDQLWCPITQGSVVAPAMQENARGKPE